MALIPSPTEWKTITKEPRGQRRGSSMALVDAALKTYWDTVDQLQTFDKQAMALVEILKVCNSWLKKKIYKPLSNSFFFGGRQRAFERRKAAIINLANNAMTRFDMFVGDGLIGGDVRELRSRLVYERHRHQYLKRDMRGGFTKSLDSGYAPERDAWVKSGKQSNVAGSVIHPLHDALNKGDHNDKELSSKVRKIMRKDVAMLGLADWLELKKFCVAQGIDSHNDSSTQCRYLTKEERLCAMVFINAHGLAEDYDGNPLTLWVKGESPPIYAMDRYGTLYTDSNAGIKWGGKFSNHSSLLSGNDVICAGNMDIQNGQILLINNNSGHYKPTKENLATCVQMLQAEGADLSRARVVVKMYVANQCWDLTWNSVAGFLTPGSNPDASKQRH